MIHLHNHIDASNIRLLDCINKTKRLIDYAVELGIDGLAITDHECLCNHIKAMRYVKELKNKEKLSKDFKLILGNEIYLVDSLEEVRDKYVSGETKFYHFLLLAKDAIGHRQLRELSSMAWENSFKTGQMERVPTIKADLQSVIAHNPGHVVASTACLGGEFPTLVLKLHELENKKDQDRIQECKQKIHDFITWCINVFGKDSFFIELQPSDMADQRIYNSRAIQIANAYDLKYIITTDAHYPRKEDRSIHEAYLKSKEGDRELEDFYSSTYLMSKDEIKGYLCDYLSTEQIQSAIDSTVVVGNMIEEYDLYHGVVVPDSDIPKFELQHLFAPVYDKFEYINKFAKSKNDCDRYLLKLIEDGFETKENNEDLDKEKFYKILHRIDIELGEIWETSIKIENNVSGYYLNTLEVINIMWDDGESGGNSLVGVARGSITGFYIAYLMNITQMNPIQWNLPHWRHLHKDRPEMPDIDIDSEASKRKRIFNALKDRFSERKVLNICTFGEEGSKSTVATACRGLGIDNDTSQYIADMIPFERGSNWSLSDCFFGNEEENRKPVKTFINEVVKYDGLKEIMLGIEGLINKRSIHASGVYIFNTDFLDYNARMKAPNGQYVTQWNMDDSDYCGGLKVDCLTIEALDKIRTCMELLLEYGYIQWQGSLRATYNKYIHPDVLDYDNPNMWKMIGDNAIVDLFQFDTDVGLTTARKVKPKNLIELATANSLMRLVGSDNSEQPVDKYVKFKNNIDLWYNEMRNKYFLKEDEIKTLEKHLSIVYGVADTQEVVMELSMDNKIANFNVVKANKLRKGIAKKKKEIQEEAKQMFFDEGVKNGTSLNMLKYVWNEQIVPQLGYSFSKNHTMPYSTIALQEMNLAYHYPIIYWNTACLTVNAGADEDNEDNKGTDYGKIAIAIGNMQQSGVKIALPDINDADFGFKPDLENNQIIFGIKGINGIGDEAVKAIVSHRPYKSLQDFLDRMVLPEKSMIANGQCVQLIKAGCFDKLEGKSREDILLQFVKNIYEPKSKLTMANLNMIMQYELLPEDMEIYHRYTNFKKYISQPEFICELIPSKKATKKGYSDRLLKLNEHSVNFFNEYFSEDSIEKYSETGETIISENKFKKEFDKKMESLKEWLSKPEVLSSLNDKIFKKTWDKYGSGNIAKWEMESLCFYYTYHELQSVNESKYNVVNFNDLPEDPVATETYIYRGKERMKYEIVRLCGTVLDRNKNKHTVTLLTTHGVVVLKFYDGAFGHYNREISRKNPDGTKTRLEKSWFSRGNKIMVCGYRRGNMFRPYKYKDSIYQHTVALITNILSDGEIIISTERVKAEE